MTLGEKAQKYTIDNVCGNCNKCQSKGYIGCDTFRFAKKAYLDRAKEEMLDPFGNSYVNDLKIENKELREQLEQAKELLKKYNNKASCCEEFMKDWTVQKLWEETNKFLNDEIFESIEE